MDWEGLLRLEHGNQVDLMAGRQDPRYPWMARRGAERKHYLGRGHLQPAHPAPGRQHPVKPVFSGNSAIRKRNHPTRSLVPHPASRTGLLSSYYPNQNWEGEPVFQQVTPFLLLAWPDETPLVSVNQFSARYQGILQITKAGNYLLRVEADDGARLTLDGVVIGEGLVAGQPNSFETTLLLAPGEHRIQLDYFQQGGGSTLRLLWKSDDQPLAPIPPDALIPPNPKP